MIRKALLVEANTGISLKPEYDHSVASEQLERKVAKKTQKPSKNSCWRICVSRWIQKLVSAIEPLGPLDDYKIL